MAKKTSPATQTKSAPAKAGSADVRQALERMTEHLAHGEWSAKLAACDVCQQSGRHQHRDEIREGKAQNRKGEFVEPACKPAERQGDDHPGNCRNRGSEQEWQMPEFDEMKRDVGTDDHHRGLQEDVGLVSGGGHD